MPPISVSRNGNYGGPQGNNKYSPLGGITVVQANSADYDALVNQRRAVLAGYFPSALTLTVPNWAAIIQQELGGAAGPLNPPLVVISSNRSTYIQRGIATVAAAQAGVPAGFNGVSDLRPLMDPPPPGAALVASPPIYCPARLGNNPRRSVYVVVHFAEYDTYKLALAGVPGITVVGWSFLPPLAPALPPLTGFGASRYAAIEFCKYLRFRAINSGAGNNPIWGSAWLFDDNVVAIANLDLQAVEGALGPNDVCAGFQGITTASPRAGTAAWINTVPAAQRDGTGLPAPPASATPNLIQQAALWNIAKLYTDKLDFSAVFVASKEDVSFTNYFDATPEAYKWYALSIRKEIVRPQDHDNSLGATAVNAARAAYTIRFATDQMGTQVQPPGNAPVTTLGAFIVNPVVSNSNAFAALPAAQKQAGSQIVQAGICHAIESIVTRAIKGGFPAPPAPPPSLAYMGPVALDQMFKPSDVRPGGVLQGFMPRDLP